MVRELEDVLFGRRQRAVGTGHARHAGALHGLDGRDLVAHETDGLGARADEHEAALFHALGEIGVFREKPVARVDRLGVGDLGGADDGRDVEVAFGGARRADAHRFVGEAHVPWRRGRLRVHRHGLDAERAAGALDAQRDLAAVGDDDFFDLGHGPWMRRRGIGPAAAQRSKRSHAGRSFDDEHRLAELHRLAVLLEDGLDRAGLVGLDLVHHLHGLDDAERIADGHGVADLDEGLGPGAGVR